jgi:hypothetical protein
VVMVEAVLEVVGEEGVVMVEEVLEVVDEEGVEHASQMHNMTLSNCCMHAS